MKKITIFSISLLISCNLFAQSILLTPQKLESKQNTAANNVVLQGTNPPNVFGFRHNGTLTSPTTVSSGNFLLELGGSGYNGTNFLTEPRVSINFAASETWSAGATGGKINFSTTDNGSSTMKTRMTIADDGKVGINTTTPGSDLEIDGNAGMNVRTYGSSFNPHIFGSSANGTSSSPTASQNNNVLARFEGHGFNGSYFEEGARVEIRAAETWASSENGSKIYFYTAPVNGDTPLNRMTIADDGNIGINETAPNHYLEIQADNDNGIAVKTFAGSIPGFFGKRASGNVNAPGATQDGNILARFGGKGYNGTGFTGAKARIEFRAANDWTSTENGAAIDFITTPATGTVDQVSMILSAPGNLGIGMSPNTSFRLQVNGDAAKNVAGNWSSHSDRRLKKNITYLNSQEILNKVLNLKGVLYEWNDTKTGTSRPSGIQYGFIAQELKEIFPSKIKEDKDGYLMAAYGDYDPMLVESIKALKELIDSQQKLIETQNRRISSLENKLTSINSTNNKTQKAE